VATASNRDYVGVPCNVFPHDMKITTALSKLQNSAFSNKICYAKSGDRTVRFAPKSGKNMTVVGEAKRLNRCLMNEIERSAANKKLS